MCGLAARFADFMNDNDKKAFNELLFLNMTRGKDSTGVFSLKHHNVGGDYMVPFVKAPIMSPLLLQSNLFHRVVAGKTYGFIGHCRAATLGNVTGANAHPFTSEDGNIIGVHNGTLTGSWAMKDKYETDSEAIFNIIANDGLEALKKVYGAYALIWWNLKEKSLNIFRNAERTLYIDSRYKTWTVASERWMIEKAVPPVANAANNAEMVPVHTHLKFTLEPHEHIVYSDGVQTKEINFKFKEERIDLASTFRKEVVAHARAPFMVAHTSATQRAGHGKVLTIPDYRKQLEEERKTLIPMTPEQRETYLESLHRKTVTLARRLQDQKMKTKKRERMSRQMLLLDQRIMAATRAKGLLRFDVATN